jgi:hypothetical protein
MVVWKSVKLVVDVIRLRTETDFHAEALHEITQTCGIDKKSIASARRAFEIAGKVVNLHS